MRFDEVAIIGGGLSGLSLALFLKQHNVQCTIYELRSPDATAAGALMLSPNALRSLDSIGLYDRIKREGWHFRAGSFRNNNHEFIDSYEFGNADKYGYDCLRVYRQVLVDQLVATVAESGMEVVNDKKFSHVVSEDESGVTFAFTNGEQHEASIVIGADGIRSAVRRYIFPEVEPSFANVMTVVGAVPTSLVEFPHDNYDLPVSINGEAGGFSLAQQNADGSEMLAAMQYPTHERDKAGWKALNEDKKQLVDILRQNYETSTETIKSAIDAIDPETLFIWPFYAVPRLSRWTSTRGRVVLLGDAAHAIPPAAGQGANQAFEDVHSLSLLMAAAQNGKVEWKDCLEWWQHYRRDRTDGATDLTLEMTRRRLPGWIWEGGTIDNAWLYNVQIVQDVETWLSCRQPTLD